MSCRPNAIAIPLGVLVWSVAACLPSNGSWLTRTRRGSVSRCTGMDKENGRWRSARELPCGIVLALTHCPFVGCSPVISQGKRPPKAPFSTNQGLTAEQIVRTIMIRWSLETTFEESRAHLGSRPNASGLTWLMTTQRPCSSVSTARSPSLGARFIPRDACLSHKRPGITNTWRPFMMSWLRFDGTFGRTSLFLHHPLIPTWF